MKKFIPTIGEKGHYRLAQPFELGPNDYYCCNLFVRYLNSQVRV